MTKTVGQLLESALVEEASEEDEDFELGSTSSDSGDDQDEIGGIKKRRSKKKQPEVLIGEEEESEQSIDEETEKLAAEVYADVRKHYIVRNSVPAKTVKALPDVLDLVTRLHCPIPTLYQARRSQNNYHNPIRIQGQRQRREQYGRTSIVEKALKEIKEMTGGLTEDDEPSLFNIEEHMSKFKERIRKNITSTFFRDAEFNAHFVKVSRRIDGDESIVEEATEEGISLSSQPLDITSIRDSLVAGRVDRTREFTYGGRRVKITERVAEDTLEGARLLRAQSQRQRIGGDLHDLSAALQGTQTVTTIDKSAKEWNQKKDGDEELRRVLAKDSSDARGTIQKKRFLADQGAREFEAHRRKKQKIELDQRRKIEAEWGDRKK